MIRSLFKIPNKVFIACSGGVDSMVILDFLLSGRKEVTVAHFDHGTDHGKDAREFVVKFCRDKNIDLVIGEIYEDKKANESPEEYWRNQRMKFLNSLPDNVITCHHLQDCIEWWLFTAMNGMPRVIPHKNKNIIRPFLITDKSSIISWASRKDVPFIEDPSNINERYSRNIIRHNIVPHALRVNPGLGTVVKKKILERYDLEKKNWRPVC